MISVKMFIEWKTKPKLYIFNSKWFSYLGKIIGKMISPLNCLLVSKQIIRFENYSDKNRKKQWNVKYLKKENVNNN